MTPPALPLLAIWSILSGALAVADPESDNKADQVKISYVAPSNTALQRIYEQMKKRRVLEAFQDYLRPLRLPGPLLIKTDDCNGDANASYEESEHAITVCYEYIEELVRNAPDTTIPAGLTPEDAVTGPTIEVFLHEIGHALFDMLKVPILGREEDAADQFAAYLMLQLEPERAWKTVAGVVYMYSLEALARDPKLQEFANVHGLPAQRLYNVMCLAYGADPKLFGIVVDRGYLPAARAEGCLDEYKHVDYAFKQLIGPHFDPTQCRTRVDK